MRIKNLLCASVFILLLPIHLFAWGHQGHQIVAELAMRQLSDATRQKVLKVLGSMTPAEAGNWMDEVRNDHAYDYMKPWHYTNIEPGQSYQPAEGGDIITALNKAYGELQYMDTLSAERLRFDVLVLFHLCGDITQPLHVGYGSDKGGNTYQVQYNGKGTNLHHIWDTDIIESQNINFSNVEYEKEWPGQDYLELLLNMQVNFLSYWYDSRNMLQVVYNFSGHKLDDTYMAENKEYVSVQLRNGGILLAACLEQVFRRAKNIPVITNPKAAKDTVNTGDTMQQTIGNVLAAQAASVVGQTVSVCGKVYSAKLTGSITYINRGGEYPNNPFTAVIMVKNRSNFTYKPEEYLAGKTICVTGIVQNYKGKPEIVVEKPEQITVQ